MREDGRPRRRPVAVSFRRHALLPKSGQVGAGGLPLHGPLRPQRAIWSDRPNDVASPLSNWRFRPGASARCRSVAPSRGRRSSLGATRCPLPIDTFTVEAAEYERQRVETVAA